MVTVYYADTSAVVRVSFAGGPEHAELRDLLASGRDRVLAGELTRIEFASAMAAAKRSGRIPDTREFSDQFDAMSRSSTLGMIPFRPSRVFPDARQADAAKANGLLVR